MIRRYRTEDNARVSLTPMIDVTFLLLVFFMVTSTITREQKRVLELAIAPSAKIVDYDPKFREIINIEADGSYYIRNNKATREEVLAFLKKRYAAKLPEPLKLNVRAEADAPGKNIKEIMKLAAEAGAIEVVFSAWKK